MTSPYYSEQGFFEAWQRAVMLSSPRLFGDGETDPAAAESKWKLRPRVDDIEAVIRQMPSSEAVYVAALVSFYNDDTGGKLLQAVVGRNVVGMADIAAALEEPRRRAIADLIISYAGW